jgi:hypothetical protein
VVFEVRGREYEIPALPAADWLELLMYDWEPDDLFIELLPNGDLFVQDMDPYEINGLAMDILEEASARRWWIATRLIACLVHTWDVMGAEAVFNHVDAERLSLSAWLDAMTLLLLRRIEPAKAPMFVAMIEKPPPGEEVDEEEFSMSTSQFMALAED